MKNTYWFSRTLSPSPKRQSKPKTLPSQENSSKKFQTELTASKAECFHSAQSILKMVQGFQELNRLNHMHHSDLVQAGAIKQLKCLKHNSAIIVYCLSDNKLLCSVCAFAGNDHAKHMINEAKGNMHHLEVNVINSEKVLKLKGQQIAEDKRQWQKQLENICRLKNQALTELEREHDDLLAALSLVYAKSKAKINEAFGQLQENLNFIVSTLDRFAASLKCSHSLSVVKQLYFQEIIAKTENFNRMMPDPKIGEVMISSSKEIVKSILKNFKNMGSAIKK